MSISGSKSVAEGWNALPPASQRSILQAIIQQSRDVAATAVMLQSQGGPNDIVKAAGDAKLAAAPSVPSQPEAPSRAIMHFANAE
jgi:hypothetical protein